MAHANVNSKIDYEAMHHIVEYVKQHATEGNVDSVIEAVDKCCGESVIALGAMHVGKEKGKIFDSVIKDCQPASVLELGAFFGYTALRAARLLKPGAMLYSVELDLEMIKVATDMIEFAGTADKVKIIPGKSSDVIARFHNNEFPVSSFDFIFMDHHKPIYKADLILMEELKLLKKGTVVLADNIVYPGCPDYAEYVRNNPKYKCTTFPGITFSSIGKQYDDEMEKCMYLGD